MIDKFHQYSFANSLLIMVQNSEATLVNSYDRWQSINLQVRKGEQGIKIFYPKKKWTTETDPNTGEKEKRQTLTGYDTGNIFDTKRTEGEPLPKAPPVTENMATDDITTAIYQYRALPLDEGITLSGDDRAQAGVLEPHQAEDRGSQRHDFSPSSPSR